MLEGLDAVLIDEQVSVNRGKKEKDSTKLNAQVAAQREERLSKGVTRRAEVAPPPPPEPEPKDRSVLFDKLTAYKERFTDLKSRNKISGKSSAEEIEDEIHYMEQQLGTKDGNMAITFLTTITAGIEHVTAHHFNPLGLNLTGLTQVTRDNQAEFQPLLDELVIKYGASMYVSPEMRLIGLMGTMIYTVHAANSGDVRTAAALQKMSATMAPVKTDL